MFDGVGTNLPSGTIRWSSTNNYFEKFNGTTWSILTARLLMTSDKLYNAAITTGATINDAAAAATNVLWTSSKINTFAGNFYTKTEIDAFKANYLLKNGENGALTFGTNDASAVNIETANTTRLSVSGTGNVNIAAPSTGVALTVAPASGQNAITATGGIQGTTLVSTVATGTAPLTVTSTTKVTNLNADLLDDMTATNANTASTIVHRDASGNFSAGTITAALSGNATTASTLATGRTIALSGGVTGTATSFNGSANITIPVTSVASSSLSGTIPDANIVGSYTGLTNLTGTGTVDFSKFLGNPADTVAAPSFSWTGDDNTGIYSPAADQVAITTGGVQRALFSSAGITGTLVGNASTATTLQTARTINGVSFNGSANISITDSSKLPTVGGTMTGTILNDDTSRFWLATATNWGIYWNTTDNKIEFRGADTVRASIDLDDGVVTAPTFSGALSGNAATATAAALTTYVDSPDGDRNAATKLPTTSPYKVRYDFVNGNTAGNPGSTYAGVMTYAPWIGNTVSTGGQSYQLSYGSDVQNTGTIPVLNIRNGIDSTWNPWYKLWHSGNDGSGSGLDADLLDGMNATTTATASTIVARDANGFVYVNALNSTLADTATAASHYLVETGSDGWMRPKTLANVKTEIAGDRLALAGGTLTGALAGTTFTGTSFNSITALASTTSPMDGTAAVGTSTAVARQDHVHPTDTSRAATNQTMFIGTTSVPINRTTGALALTGVSIDGNAATATTATNQSGGTVAATTGSFSQSLTAGFQCTVSGSNSMAFGAFSSASGDTSSIAIGYMVRSNGRHSIAMGRNSHTLGRDLFAYASGYGYHEDETRPQQYVQMTLQARSTSTTAVRALCSAYYGMSMTNNQYTLPANSAATFRVIANAKLAGSAGAITQTKGFRIDGVITRGAAVSNTLVSISTITASGAGTLGATISVVADTANGGLAINCASGASGSNVSWTINVEAVETIDD
jgi:hypothetical protein